MTEQQWLEWIEENLKKADVHGPLGKYTADIILATHLSDIVSRLPEKRELPIIPQFVADYIERYKDTELSMEDWFTDGGNESGNEFEKDTFKWLYDNDYKTNCEREYILHTAIRKGYVVESDPVEVITEKLINHIRSNDFEDTLRSSLREFVIKNGAQ